MFFALAGDLPQRRTQMSPRTTQNDKLMLGAAAVRGEAVCAPRLRVGRHVERHAADREQRKHGANS